MFCCESMIFIFLSCYHTTKLIIFNEFYLISYFTYSLSSNSFIVAMTTETSSKLLDGKLVAKKIRDEIAGEISSIKESTGIVPGLAVILVGSRKDSQTYVRNKKKACEDVGITSFEVNLPEDCSEEEIIKHISKFNCNPSVHGILVQLPLPRVCCIPCFFNDAALICLLQQILYLNFYVFSLVCVILFRKIYIYVYIQFLCIYISIT